MSQSISLERVGQRVYFRGNTFAAKDRIKAMGGHWDADARAWWVGAKKEAQAQALAAELLGPVASAAAQVGLSADAPAGVVADRLRDEGRESEAAAVQAAADAPKPAEDVSHCRVYAQVTYKGRRYYVIAEQRGQDGQPVRCRLTTLDELTPFWVDCQVCDLVRTYEGREQWDGRYCSGKTRTVYSTIGSLREFRDGQQSARKSGAPVCAECGRAGGELVADLEDGLMKHRRCCDIAP